MFFRTFFLLFFCMQNFCQHQLMATCKQQIMELSSAFILSRAIHTAAELGIADQLLNGPRTATEIAQTLCADITAVYRLLRFLSSYGIFEETSFKTFALTELATPLLSNHPESLRSWLMHHDGTINRWNAYGNMTYSILNNKPAFDAIYGAPYFEYISQDSVLAEGFDEGMKNISSDEEVTLVNAYDFSSYPCIVDIGGGKGSFLAYILTTYNKHYGMVYDLPHTIASAQRYLADYSCNKRIVCEAGSFFDSIPSRGDLYILKRILHDWNDEQCIHILQNCKKSMHQDARLLIIETIVSDANERDFAKDIDMAMLVLFGGKERTLAEWHYLVEAAGLTISAVHQTESLVHIIEVTK